MGKQKGRVLKDEKDELIRKKEDLNLQLSDQKLSFPEARDKLLNKVKEDNQIILKSERRKTELKKEIENEMQERKAPQGELQKYEILYQKDKEMTEYIESFEENKEKEIKAIENIENEIIKILEYSSEQIKRKVILPTKDE